MRAAPTPASDTSEESRAFLQQRVALFWKALFFISLIGEVPDLLYVIGGNGLPMHIVLSAVSAAVYCSLWMLCRRGTRSIRFSRTVEVLGLLATAVIIAFMGRFLVSAVGPHISENIDNTLPNHPMIDGYLSMMIIFGATLIAAIRAAIIPSRMMRTIWITAAVGVPFVLSTALVKPPFDGSLQVHFSGSLDAWRLPGMLSLWWGFTIITCAIISKVIYGLRAEVSEARQLGQYVLERKLGEGGMGVVYRASHGMMRRPTAVKLLPPDRAGENALARFEREVRLTARLTHPNTITIFDYGRTDDGVFYYAMELLDGATLEEIIKADGPQPAGRVMRILSMVSGALTEAHGVGLIHRDIKPANIMLCSQGGEQDVVKVLDFGLVKQLEVEQDVHLTGADTVAGTPLYMAPECIRDANAVDARADIYAVGAVGYYVLTGTNVFEAESMIEVCSMHLHERPEAPSKRLGGPVPDELEALLLACLEKDPTDRPQSARELRERVDAIAASPWDARNARDWWTEHGEALRESGNGEVPANAKTIAVQLSREASESSTSPG